jgi:hypothetical protein
MYKDYLIEEGFKDGKIFRNAKTKRIKLRGRDNTKSIYSVEYIAKKFFDKKQLHFAADDVIIEGMLLQKIIRDHGYYKLKLNSMYPSDIYRMFLQRIIENYHNKIETHYMISDISKTDNQFQGNELAKTAIPTTDNQFQGNEIQKTAISKIEISKTDNQFQGNEIQKTEISKIELPKTTISKTNVEFID